MLMPGAPLLEQALSQKQFIIKKGQAKSKQRGSKSKGARTNNTLMRAYFPNLISKNKDATMISPTAIAS